MKNRKLSCLLEKANVGHRTLQRPEFLKMPERPWIFAEKQDSRMFGLNCGFQIQNMILSSNLAAALVTRIKRRGISMAPIRCRSSGKLVRKVVGVAWQVRRHSFGK